jgi:hypothetical protein
MSKSNLLVQNYINVKEKVKQLGCNKPEGLALLPRNFEKANFKEDLVHEGTVDTVRKLWKQIKYYYNLRCKLIHERASVGINDTQIEDYTKIVQRTLKKLFKLQF